MKYCERESQRIQRLSEAFAKEAILSRKTSALQEEHSRLTDAERNRRHRSAARIQALHRGRIDRRIATRRRAETRVLGALQNLIVELGNPELKDDETGGIMNLAGNGAAAAALLGMRDLASITQPSGRTGKVGADLSGGAGGGGRRVVSSAYASAPSSATAAGAAGPKHGVAHRSSLRSPLPTARTDTDRAYSAVVGMGGTPRAVNFDAGADRAYSGGRGGSCLETTGMTGVTGPASSLDSEGGFSGGGVGYISSPSRSDAGALTPLPPSRYPGDESTHTAHTGHSDLFSPGAHSRPSREGRARGAAVATGDPFSPGLSLSPSRSTTAPNQASAASVSMSNMSHTGRSFDSSFGMDTSADETDGLRLTFPALPQAAEYAMRTAGSRFHQRQCVVTDAVNIGLAADLVDFDKASALGLLADLADHCGPGPFRVWLQGYCPKRTMQPPHDLQPLPQETDFCMSTEATCLLLCELALELTLVESPSATNSHTVETSHNHRKNGVTQLCLLFRLLAGASDLALEAVATEGAEAEPAVRFSDVWLLMEEAWLARRAPAGAQVLGLLSRARAAVGRRAAKSACPASAVVLGLLPPSEHGRATSVPGNRALSSTADTAALRRVLRGVGVTVSRENSTMLLKLASWGSLAAVGGADGCRAGQLAAWLGPMQSFRGVQRRWQTWMRALPSVLDTTAAAFQGGGGVSPEDFVAVCGQTALPTSQAEALMMAQVLQRDPQRTNALEVHLLGSIAKGRFSNVALS